MITEIGRYISPQGISEEGQSYPFGFAIDDCAPCVCHDVVGDVVDIEVE